MLSSCEGGRRSPDDRAAAVAAAIAEPVPEQRGEQIRKMLEATMERGKHVILFGERGVGKTSLAKVFHNLFPTTLRHIFSVREQADPSDTFSSIWRKVFKDVHVRACRNGNSELVPVADFYSSADIAPDDIRRELEGLFKPNDIPVLIIDEYDKLGDRQRTNELMANTIKSLSDYGINVTVILVGVADNINDLMGEHASLGRCVEQIPMPRMTITERREILQKIVPRLGMKLHDNAMWKFTSHAACHLMCIPWGSIRLKARSIGDLRS